MTVFCVRSRRDLERIHELVFLRILELPQRDNDEKAKRTVRHNNKRLGRFLCHRNNKQRSYAAPSPSPQLRLMTNRKRRQARDRKKSGGRKTSARSTVLASGEIYSGAIYNGLPHGVGKTQDAEGTTLFEGMYHRGRRISGILSQGGVGEHCLGDVVWTGLLLSHCTRRALVLRVARALTFLILLGYLGYSQTYVNGVFASFQAPLCSASYPLNFHTIILRHQAYWSTARADTASLFSTMARKNV